MTGEIAALAGTPELSVGGVVAGRFEVRAQVARDALGELYAALDRKTGAQVVLRRPLDATRRPVEGNAAGALSKLVKRVAAVQQAHLVPVFGTSQTADGEGLIVEGGRAGRSAAEYIRARLEGGRPVSLKSALNIAAHVGRALLAMHEAGSVHGAVSPESVWVADDGSVQLADAVAAALLLGGPGVAAAPSALWPFLAPELSQGQPPSVAGDVFSLAAFFGTLLAGRPSSPGEALPNWLGPSTPPEIVAVIERAMAESPASRFADVAAFLRGLGLEGSLPQRSVAGDGLDDIDVEIALSTRPPPTPSDGAAQVSVVSAPGRASVAHARAGSRVSIEEEFRLSEVVEDEVEAQAARERRSLGEVHLRDVLAKIGEDDTPRWMLVKNGMDHGPFSGRQLVGMIIEGGALREHELLNTDTGTTGKIGAFPEFADFLTQYELKRAEQDRVDALKHREVKEKRGALFKVGVGLASVLMLAGGIGIYALTRSEAREVGQGASEASDLYKRGALEVKGAAGILPASRGKSGRARSGGGGGMSYEDAMMQAVDIGSAASGGEATLNAATVAKVMDRQLGGIFASCVRGSVGKVVVDIAIAGSGRVLGVSVRAGDPAFQSCVAQRVRAAQFPGFSAPRMGARYSFDT